MARLAGLVVAAALGGCYAEVGGAFYPVVRETVTPAAGAAEEHDTHAWALVIKVGFVCP